MKTQQEIFDETTRFLFTQGGPSIGETTCAYRGKNGRKCAVGYWIPDSHYSPAIESQGVCMDGKTITAALEPMIPPELHQHAPLLHELQKGHDRANYFGTRSPSTWINAWEETYGIASILEWIAAKFNLNPGVVYACWPKTKENVA